MSNGSEYYKKYEPLFGSWKIKSVIGEGSFGTVFKIEREEFGNTYSAALKAITFTGSRTELDALERNGMTGENAEEYLTNFIKGFINELSLISTLKGQSNIVSYEDHMVYDREDGIGKDILIKMELLTPLDEYFREKTVTEEEVIRLGIDMCKALEICGKHNIIHRDIKPKNIFVNKDGDFKLGDFGIARQMEKTLSRGTRAGTLAYMAPEVFMCNPYNSSADIYSLGIVLYKLLNHNRDPFLPNYPEKYTYNATKIAQNKRLKGYPLPSPDSVSSQRLCSVILRACKYDPDERFASPTEMRHELEDIYNSEYVKKPSKARSANPFDDLTLTDGGIPRCIRTAGKAAAPHTGIPSTQSESTPLSPPVNTPRSVPYTSVKHEEKKIPKRWIIICAAATLIAVTAAVAIIIAVVSDTDTAVYTPDSVPFSSICSNDGAAADTGISLL